jgi:beta-lactamase regulating signal transducer with metallopeptidase domain
MNSLQWFQIVLSLAVQASLLTLAARWLEACCASARLKTRVWTCYYLGALGLVTIALVLPRVRWPIPWQKLHADHLLTVIRAEQCLGALLLAVWIAGTGLNLIRWVVNFVRLQYFLRACPHVDERRLASLQALTPEARRSLPGRPIQFRLCPEHLGPFCYQLHVPMVFLPPSLLDGDARELDYVLQHELAHLRTQHPLQAFAQRLVEAILWFLPGVWDAGRRASLAREFVCDDAAVGWGTSAASYLRVLLRFAERRPACCGAVLAVVSSANELKVRANRLAAPRAASRRLAALAPAAVLLAALTASQLWLPSNPLDSSKSFYSPWPAWSAAGLHALDVNVPDFDPFDPQMQVHELIEANMHHQAAAVH